MSRGVNKVIILGNTCADTIVKYTAAGTAIATVNVATNESWTDKQTGEKHERSEFHRIQFFGRLAEIAGEYLKKGRQVYIEGSIRTDKYTDKEGIERYSTSIIANEMQMLGGGGGGGGGDDRALYKAPAERTQRTQSSGGQANRQEARREAPPPDDFDSDIPF